MTDQPDPNDDRPLLQRAIDIAFPIVESDVAVPDIVQLLAAGDVSNERLLAHAFLGAMDRLVQTGKKPPLYRCGWCVAAAGDDEAAWQAAPSMDVAAIRQHTLTCEHNPLVKRIGELEALINTPRTDEFFDAVKLEAAHQIDRWGTAHDDGKTDPDWFWLIGYLAGKALRGDEKRLHHIITTAAVVLNWWRHATGVSTAMRPGIAPDEITVPAPESSR